MRNERPNELVEANYCVLANAERRWIAHENRSAQIRSRIAAAASVRDTLHRVRRGYSDRVALVRTQRWRRISNENLWPFAARAQYCTTRRVSFSCVHQHSRLNMWIPFSATA